MTIKPERAAQSCCLDSVLQNFLFTPLKYLKNYFPLAGISPVHHLILSYQLTLPVLQLYPDVTQNHIMLINKTSVLGFYKIQSSVI